MSIRLSKACKDLNVGMTTAIEFLAKKGHKLSVDPNLKLSDDLHLLQQKIEQLEGQVEQLEKQLEYVKANEAWLKQQLDQKLIEHKNHEKKGLLGRLFG